MKPKTEKERLMNLIARKIADTPIGNPEDMALRIKQEAPTLAGLNAEQLEQVARLVITQRLTNELNTKVDLAGIDWKQERETFLQNAGREKSRHTYTAYAAALNRLESYADKLKINPLSLTPAQADDFIYALQTEGRAPASVRLDTAAGSSFFTFLERRHAGITNPFRGTKARPPKKDVRKTEIPSAKEVKIIIGALGPMEAAAVQVMAYRGLRAGALPEMSIKAGRFTTHSKGKDISGAMPKEVIDAIKTAELSLQKPFKTPEGYKTENWTDTLEHRIKKITQALYKAGKINAAYSCHDFRHFYAVAEYRKTKDIHRPRRHRSHRKIPQGIRRNRLMEKYIISVYPDPDVENLWRAVGENFRGLVMSAYSIDVLIERTNLAVSDLLGLNKFNVEYRMTYNAEVNFG
jgi:site-specific recombinase XerD